MKRIFIIICIALACAAIGWAAYRAASPPDTPLSKFVPAGPLLYLEAQDFSSLLGDWNSSPQKKRWIQSDSYEVFSRSRLFLRLKGAGDQFAAAAGLPPDLDFVSQVAGERSALALYDIGKLQFLYITYLPTAKSMQTALYQGRTKFEPRNAGGVDFYLRRDPESKREVAFAIAGDYLLLATREDLMAGALQLMSGKQDRTMESETWWRQSTSEAGHAGDLRMVLDLQTLVPNGYFRTYWVQQNITELSQYSAAVSDLFRSDKRYREERVLIRKKEQEQPASPEGLAAAADLSRLVPDDAGVYVATANPPSSSCLALVETKLLAPHLGAPPASQFAPQVQLTSGEQGASSDLETRIDLPPAESPAPGDSASALKALIEKTPALASLQLQSTQRDAGGVFIRIRSAVVLASASDWNEVGVQSAIADLVRPGLTASQLGVAWTAKSGYQQLDGLWPLTVSVHGKYLVVSDDPVLMESVLANFTRKSERKPLALYAGFDHKHERDDFLRFSNLVDRTNLGLQVGGNREPQFFSGNMVGLSTTLAAVSAESIEIHPDSGKMRQTVTYEWSQ
ncbi:MAG TPA: hypothetical protein VE377_05120 [Candidatus Dormibacteraeota bacterium]|nr:hypothetical protein [Candidatus Dormibacteraeota bacterium]